MMARYVWNTNNNIVALYGTRDSFRCRQRNRDSEGLKVGSFKFISYKEMLREKRSLIVNFMTRFTLIPWQNCK